MCVGQPCMEREERHLDRKRDSKREEEQHASLGSEYQIAGLHCRQDRYKIERAAEACLVGIDEEQRDYRDQHQQAA